MLMDVIPLDASLVKGSHGRQGPRAMTVRCITRHAHLAGAGDAVGGRLRRCGAT
jgi:hypothetical protein